MKSFFNKVKGKIHGTREKMRDYWKRMMGTSTHIKISEGAREADRVMTSAHREQWRRPKK